MPSSLALALALCAAPAPADPPPVAWARQQLAGGHLAQWERAWCTRMVAGKYHPPQTAFVTSYGPWDRGHYRGDTYHIASNVLRQGTVVWLEGDRALKVVTNSGASRNDHWARNPRRGECRKPACFWVDRWCKTRRDDNGNQRLYVVGDAPEWRKR